MDTEQIQKLVGECGLNWQRGYMSLFKGDIINRYEVLIQAVLAIERANQKQLDMGEDSEHDWRAGHLPEKIEKLT